MKSLNNCFFKAINKEESLLSKKWYPVINYVVCAECGSCVDMCPHGVYDTGKSLTPIVINRDDCN